MTNDLIAVANGRTMGTLRYQSGRASFEYDPLWRDDGNSFPLSLSMPLAMRDHGHSRVDSFLWGLLPDNEQVLQRWASRYQVSARNSFRLIEHVGEDCAGAVQFIRPERLDSVLTEPASREVTWLAEQDIAERLRTLRADHSIWRMDADAGQFSLAGAQPKTALISDGKRWGIPSGRTPTTHILKPPTGEWDGHAENEHFCLTLARACGLIVPNSRVLRFSDEIAIVIERFDRLKTPTGWLRVHQEDFCQALGVHPAMKYESQHGPGIRQIVELLRQRSSAAGEDIDSFLDAIIFNWLIAGTDAHAKNFALLLGTNGAVRLAPFYDLASVLPYRSIDPKRAKLAMKVGGEYRIANITLRNWRKMAAEIRADEDRLISRIRNMTGEFSDLVSQVHQQISAQGLTHPLISRLAEALVKRAQSCQKLLDLDRAVSDSTTS
ncbi:MAG TPA: type II toxin-antitoxin system HipA family toxin [Acidobacteriaceae bacterium]|jgi:serine/threonine-protein kinase HipA|nr:type II toxin-antitoxin system HipA family toxin [Acidobacteriaceae bacterium]